jgi:hypothetical protein
MICCTFAQCQCYETKKAEPRVNPLKSHLHALPCTSASSSLYQNYVGKKKKKEKKRKVREKAVGHLNVT